VWLVALALLSSCSSGGKAAKLADHPDTPEARIAAMSLLAKGDLPEDFHLVRPTSNVPPDGQDPDVCAGLRTVSDQFGPAQSTWQIDYGFETKFDGVIVSQFSSIWAEPIAIKRRDLSIPIAQACWPARIEANIRRGLPPTGVEIVAVTSERIDLADGDNSVAFGIRVTASMREAGIVLPVYFDFFYLAEARIASRLEVRRQIEPPDPALELSLVRAVSGRMRQAQ
jgi:hypothetical protein